MHFKTYFDRFTGARGAKATEMTKHGLSTTKWCRPTCKSTRATRSTTNGYQKPTIPYERWKRDLARLHAWVETKSCMQLFDGEHDRGELACCYEHYKLARNAGSCTRTATQGPRPS